MVTAVIPVYNEASRIEKVLQRAALQVDEIIVVDDNSTDSSAEIAHKYARVLKHDVNKGYIFSIKRGFQEARYPIIVTLDGDGEHNPEDIPGLIKPIIDGEADVVLGTRERIPRISERVINFLANYKVYTKDCGTGFRALRSDIAKSLKLEGVCTCGIFVLEATYLGAQVKDIDISTTKIDKERGVAHYHLKQIFIVLKWVLFFVLGVEEKLF